MPKKKWQSTVLFSFIFLPRRNGGMRIPLFTVPDEDRRGNTPQLVSQKAAKLGTEAGCMPKKKWQLIALFVCLLRAARFCTLPALQTLRNRAAASGGQHVARGL